MNLRRLLSNLGGIWVWQRDRNEVRETLDSGFLSCEETDYVMSQASAARNSFASTMLKPEAKSLSSIQGTEIWIQLLATEPIHRYKFL